MQHRNALIAAGSLVAVVTAAVVAVGVNVGLLGATGDDQLGQLSATTAVPSPVTEATAPPTTIVEVTVVDPALAPAPAAGAEPAPGTDPSAASTDAPAPSAQWDDDGGDDDRDHESDDGHDDDHGDDDHESEEHEGRDDDD